MLDARFDRVTAFDADRFRVAILEGRSRATANKWTRIAKEFFKGAVDRELIPKNPFSHVRGLTVAPDKQRRVFVPAEVVQKVIDVIPCPEFKLIVALARWGGLRVPSEPLELTWADVDLPNGRLIVRAPKTQHHRDGGVRIVPIFPEVRPFLEALWDAAPEGGGGYVITRSRGRPSIALNLRTQFNRYCVMAGAVPWPKPFQNLRVSRATELADHFPSHVCSAWLGHSVAIADRYYRMTTDEHFAKGLTFTAKQNPKQQDTETNGMERNPTLDGILYVNTNQQFASSINSVHKRTLGVEGIEPPTSCL